MEDVNTVPASVTSADAVKALMVLRAEMVQREARMSAAINEQVQALRREVGQFRRDVAGIVDSANIAHGARGAMSPVAAEYGHAAASAVAHMRRAGRLVWMWLATAGTMLVLAVFVAWTVLGYYRRELASTQEELQRYEDAVPVVQAFYASDAVICGGVICAHADPAGARAGDKGQYRAARPRPRP
ncbi:hypothetical protein [Pseudoxanthomonas sp.]|jgi:heme exporter protein D|uniref:hypothetical protein n=1 Tax=Pseudoxanthomonas sp. TaxID=1871049 RepID=UPI002E0F1E43|nr:hypothetical protein [Pseudoxanthomonas sp.]